MKKVPLSSLILAEKYPVNLKNLGNKPYIYDDMPGYIKIESTQTVSIKPMESVVGHLSSHTMFAVNCIEHTDPDQYGYSSIIFNTFYKPFSVGAQEIIVLLNNIPQLNSYFANKLIVTVSQDIYGGVDDIKLTNYFQDPLDVIVVPFG